MSASETAGAIRTSHAATARNARHPTMSDQCRPVAFADASSWMTTCAGGAELLLAVDGAPGAGLRIGFPEETVASLREPAISHRHMHAAATGRNRAPQCGDGTRKNVTPAEDRRS